MRDCKNCDSFEGYDEDGYPVCELGDGCPYNDEADVKEDDCGLRMEIDTTQFTEYLRNTMANTSTSAAERVINKTITTIVTDTYTDEIKKMTRDAMQQIVSQQVQEYMNGPITIGGGWREPERTLSRTEYLTECIQENLKSVDQEKIKSMAENIARDYLVKFSRNLKNDINRDIQKMFDDATRQTLTASVVDMLMTNDTYQKLSTSMSKLLPEKGDI